MKFALRAVNFSYTIDSTSKDAPTYPFWYLFVESHQTTHCDKYEVKQPN